MRFFHRRRAVRRATLRVLAWSALLWAIPLAARADVSLNDDSPGAPALFADGMVLQRDAAAPVWGHAAPGEVVTVTIAGQTKTTTTADDSRWRIVLDPLTAGGPWDLTISGSNTIVLSDVLIGDVWICAGQSNMVIHRADQSDLDTTPDIRTLARSGRWYDRPSGVAIGFARTLQDALGVPIGILNRAAGGTSIRSWMPAAVLDDGDLAVRDIVQWWDTFGDQYAHQVKPFEGFAIRGVAYWQGEQDLKLARQDPGNIDHYFVLLPAMIRAWRAEWQRSDLPFVFMQLPTGGGLQAGQTAPAQPPAPPDPDIAAKMRVATFNGLSEPYTALAFSIDIDGGVHPRNRDQYAERIGNAALGTAYGIAFPYSGPVFSSLAMEAAGHVRLHFRTNTASGLHAEGGPLQGFSISADGTNFVWASAAIDGEDVVVWNDAVPSPVEVRYGWGHEPTWANLFNDSELGAAPFSTKTTPAP